MNTAGNRDEARRVYSPPQYQRNHDPIATLKQMADEVDEIPARVVRDVLAGR